MLSQYLVIGLAIVECDPARSDGILVLVSIQA
jgi:hypothetical protein